MATTTTNLALTKSAGSENYSIDIVNANLDKIDAGCVNVSQAQTIAGVKTFANDVNINTASNSFIVTRDTRLVSGTIPSSELQHAIIYRASSGTANHGYITWATQTDGSGKMYLAVRDYTGLNNRSMITLNASSTPHITATYRTYNSTNTDDVVTIGSLQASTDVVHTGGNEIVGGNKTFTRAIIGYASGKFLGACGPNNANAGNTYLMAKISSNLPNNEGCVFHIVGGLNNLNYVYAVYRAFKISSTLSIQCIFKSYTGQYQKPKLYIYNNNGTIEIYGTSMSWCVPNLFFDYWENGGLYYYDLNRYTMTVSTDFSTVSLPSGAIAETGLLTEM